LKSPAAALARRSRQLGVESDIAELAIGHKRKRLYNFDEAWKLRCDAFAKVSDRVAELLRTANAEGKVVAIPVQS
jgi:hypothetical protein